MTTISASKARNRLYQLIDETAKSHAPVTIIGGLNNAVLISAAEWASIQETLYLLAMPGMSESIQEGIRTPLDACDTELRW